MSTPVPSSFFSLCIEGTKGAGKSSTIALLSKELGARNVDVEICAPFAEADAFARSQGFGGAVPMINASKADNRREIDFILSTITSATRNAQAKASRTGKPTLLLFDRGWLTAMPHLYNGKWFAEDRDNPAEIHHLFDRLRREAPPTVFLHASLEVTKNRRKNLDAISGLETEEKLRNEIEGRVAFAGKFKDQIALAFDAGGTPQNEVVEKIFSYVTANLTLPPAASPPARAKFVALYPGSYNLSTLAHRDIGLAVLGLIKPDEVWYLVSPQNPHKSAEGMASFEDRMEMARLNVEGEPRLVVTGIEKEISERTGSTRTADTLRELIRLYPDIHFALVMGADNFAVMMGAESSAKSHSWHDPEYILSNAPIIVFPRKGFTEAARASPAAKFIGELENAKDLRTKNGWHIVMEYPEGGGSATKERDALKAGKPLDPRKVKPSVFAYIQRHKPNF